LEDGLIARLCVNCTGATGILTDEPVTEMLLYPNPTEGIIYLSGVSRAIDLKVFDVNGKEVEHARDENSIDLSPLVPGLYFVQLTGESFTETIKVIVQ